MYDLQQNGAPSAQRTVEAEENAAKGTGTKASIDAAKAPVTRLKELLKTTDAAHPYLGEARIKLLAAQEALKKAERAFLLDQWEEAIAFAKKAEVTSQRVIIRLQGEGELKFMEKADVEILQPRF